MVQSRRIARRLPNTAGGRGGHDEKRASHFGLGGLELNGWDLGADRLDSRVGPFSPYARSSRSRSKRHVPVRPRDFFLFFASLPLLDFFSFFLLNPQLDPTI